MSILVGFLLRKNERGGTRVAPCLVRVLICVVGVPACPGIKLEVGSVSLIAVRASSNSIRFIDQFA